MSQEDQALPTQAELAELSAAVCAWQEAVYRAEQMEQGLRTLHASIEKLETDVIPGLMASAGNISEFKTAAGASVTLKDELYASISAANQPAAFAWLEQQGHGGVIKDQFTVALGKGDRATQQASALQKALESLGIDDYRRKRAVHPQTLQALLREQLAEGVDVPKETFGVYQVRRAKIKL